jgi:hypothetical protein
LAQPCYLPEENHRPLEGERERGEKADKTCVTGRSVSGQGTNIADALQSLSHALPRQSHVHWMRERVVGIWKPLMSEAQRFCNMTAPDTIDRFCSYFDGELIRIKSIESRWHAKILLVAILETLARVRNPDIGSNKERFLRLIDICTDWTNGNRVSLYQLSLTPSLSSALQTFTIRAIEKWTYGHMRGLERDPFISDVLRIADTEAERTAIQESKHANLLYIYRNHLVHEFREPGSGSEMDHKDDAPYYYGLSHMNRQGKIEKETWELVYPLGFFFRLAKSSINNIRSYLQNNHLDPYSFYDFRTMWKRKI